MSLPLEPMYPLSVGLRRVSIRRRNRPDIQQDVVVVEEPLQISVNGKSLVVTMRTPGHDRELAAGFLWAEGVLTGPGQLMSLTGPSPSTPTGRIGGDTQIRVRDFAGDRIDVTITEEVAGSVRARPEREFRATAACGVCGKTEIADLQQDLPSISRIDTSPALLEKLEHLPDRLRQAQKLFDATGGIHAAGIFDLEGQLLCAYEDIGRHNAVDKAIGHFVLLDHMPLSDHILVVSGRAGFELVQKALKAAIPLMVSVGAASSLAVSMATEAGMALYSFAGPGKGNLHLKDE
jgi:FdhD protein